MQITVVNVKGKQPCDVYVGRPSVLGNPFVLGRDGNREEVIVKYRKWLNGKLLSNSAQRREVGRIAGLAKQGPVRLGCWCAPLKCHGDVIAEAVRALL